MALFSRQKTYPSLVIFEDKIQVLQLDKSQKTAVNLAESELEKGTIDSGIIKDTDKLTNVLKSLIKAAKLGGKHFVVGIPENKSYTKVLKLPKLKTDELAEAVTWEAETYLPIPLEQVYLDWKIIDQDQSQITSLIVAVPKETIDAYTQVLKSVNLSPIAFETTALSLVRLVEQRNERILVILINSKNAVLTLTRGKAIQASSIVEFNGNKKDKRTQELIETINKMIEFYDKDQEEQEKVKNIVLCGEGANQNLVKDIQNKTKHKAEIYSETVENISKEKAQQFSLIVSLAKKKIESPMGTETVNLLPPEIQKNYDELERRISYKRLLTVSTTVLSFCTLSSIATLIYLNSMHSSFQSEKLSLPPLPKETGEAIKKTNNINRSARTVVEVSSKRVFSQKRLAKLISTVPDGILVLNTSIDEVQNILQITGIARTRENLLQFRDNIDSSDEFDNAILPLSSLQRAENINFVLKANMRGHE